MWIEVVFCVQHDKPVLARPILQLSKEIGVALDQEELVCVSELFDLPDRVRDVLELAKAEKAVRRGLGQDEDET